MRFESLKKEFSWQFLALCVVVGVISAAFTELVNLATWFCHRMYSFGGWVTYIYIPLMITATVYLLKKYFPYADGSGLPQGYAVDVFDSERLNNTYSLRSMVGKLLLTFMSIAGGASLGKEGPTIQVCSSLFAQLRNLSDGRRRMLIKLGAGVGVAAAFNTPVGGMVFVIEEYLKKINPHVATILVAATGIAVTVADLCSWSNTPYLGFINQELLHPSFGILLCALLIGVVSGLAGALFTKLVVFVTVDKTWIVNRWRKQHYLVNALFCGLLIAFIGHLTGGLSFGNGSETTRQFLDSGTNAPWHYALGKFSGALASVAAGAPGGYFSTALSIGAGIGDLLHHLISGFPLAQFYLLGMAAFLAAITQAPITAVAMVVEMSNSSQFSLPILCAAFLGSLIAEQFGDSVYHQQVLNYVDKSRYQETL